jgi:hypothetical protein
MPMDIRSALHLPNSALDLSKTLIRANEEYANDMNKECNFTDEQYLCRAEVGHRLLWL